MIIYKQKQKLWKFQVIEEEGLQQNSLEVGTYFLDKLCGMRREWKAIGDVRGKGLMIGVELVDSDQEDGDNKGPTRPLNSRAMSRIKHDCLKMGLLIGIGGVRSNVSNKRFTGIMKLETTTVTGICTKKKDGQINDFC